MHELIENMRGALDAWGELTEVLLNAFSLICIIAGVIISITRSIQDRQRLPGAHPMHSYFRKVFGGWLVVALEIQLAADIVGTIVSPSNAHLIELGAIAVIRTFLNYFLNRELKKETDYGKGLLPQRSERRVV
jgi:uncharacterized membrane protein